MTNVLNAYLQTIQSINRIEFIWNDNKTGYKIEYCDEDEIRRHLIYTPQYGINRAIDGYIHYICRHPSSIQQVMKRMPVDGPYTFSTESIGFSLHLIHPEQSRPYLDKIIKDTIHEFLYNEINKDD